METGREEQLKFAKHFERAQGWLLLENHAAAERALRIRRLSPTWIVSAFPHMSRIT